LPRRGIPARAGFPLTPGSRLTAIQAVSLGRGTRNRLPRRGSRLRGRARFMGGPAAGPWTQGSRNSSRARGPAKPGPTFGHHPVSRDEPQRDRRRICSCFPRFSVEDQRRLSIALWMWLVARRAPRKLLDGAGLQRHGRGELVPAPRDGCSQDRRGSQHRLVMPFNHTVRYPDTTQDRVFFGDQKPRDPESARSEAHLLLGATRSVPPFSSEGRSERRGNVSGSPSGVVWHRF